VNIGSPSFLMRRPFCLTFSLSGVRTARTTQVLSVYTGNIFIPSPLFVVKVGQSPSEL
jgi:hypothetical protein